MKKIYVITTIFSVFIFNVHFAQISLSWARGAGSSSDDFSEDIAVDKWGNSYVTGYFNSALSYGGFTLNPAGGTDVFVAKLNALGNITWAEVIGGSGADQVGSICIDSQQSIYVVGWFSGGADFDPGPSTYSMTSIGTTDAFICKLDSGGNFMWAKQFGGTGLTYASDVVADSLGGIYVTGYFTQSGDFNPGPATNTLTSAGSNDMFVCKLNSLGNFVWAKSIGEANNDAGSVICSWRDHVFISGTFNNTCDLDPGAGTYPVTSNGGYDIFILDLDSAGNFSWGGSIGGTLTEDCRDITTDNNGNIYATGFFEGTSDFNPGPPTYSLTSAGSEDIFVVKLNSAGTLKWARSMGGPSQDDGNGIKIDDGYVITTGFFNASGDFDPGNDYAYTLTSSGNADIFISQLDLNGYFVCAASVGGPGSDVSHAVGTDSTGMVYITGVYSGYTTLPADFDPGAGSFTMTSTNSTYDIFEAKYSACNILSGLATNKNSGDIISAYPNPTSDMLLLSNTTDFLSAEIINSKGQLMKKVDKNSGTEINMSDLPNGIYLLHVKTSGGYYTSKIVKD